MHTLVLGTLAFDSIETPFGARDEVVGGSGTYISLAARYMADSVGLVSVAGEDFTDQPIAMLRERGIDTGGVEVVEGGRTFRWAGRYHYDLNQRDTLDTQLNVLAEFEPVVPDAYRDAEIVCLGNLDPSIQLQVVEQVSDPELVVCDTMNFWIENTREALDELLGHVDVLIINDSEARELADEPNLIKAARIIRAQGPRMLVIKKGEHGALLFMDDVIFSAPAYPLEDIQDPTGAGDSFAGGFIGYLSRASRFGQSELKRAMIYGSALASYVVEAFGPERILDLSGDEIGRRAREFRELTAIPELEAMPA